MFGLVVMEGMTPSGHLLNINEIKTLHLMCFEENTDLKFSYFQPLDTYFYLYLTGA